MRNLWEGFTTLCRWLWRLLAFIRTSIVNALVLCLIIAAAAVFWNGYNDTNQSVVIKPGALVLDLSGSIDDAVPFSSLPTGYLTRHLMRSPTFNNSLFELVAALRQAKEDKNITGLILKLQAFEGTNHPTLRYIGKALCEFRDSGKPIYAVGDNYSQDQYYLASFANTIALSPIGTVDLFGLSAQRLYYKTLFDKLKISSHVFRVGSYKSAVEPLLRDDMSSEVKAEAQQRLNLTWQYYLSDIASNRNVSPQLLAPENGTYIEQLTALQGDTAQYALKNQWVDKISSRNEMREMLINAFGSNEKTHDLNAVSIYDYLLKQAKREQHHIAVIIANGAITYGDKKPNFDDNKHIVSSEDTVKLLRQARFDKKIKAVVLRINSPGGSVIASEVIRSEMVALKKAGKPIVVSMGGAAASGGYWIATAADHIIASETTVTGSIGIFGIINTYEKTLHALGVHADGVATSPLADFSVVKPLHPSVKQVIQLTVEQGYHRFIDLVATARDQTPQQIEPLAQGRVWLGMEAYQKGLVDQVGDFDDAIAKAAALADLKHYQLTWLTLHPKSILDCILNKLKPIVQGWSPISWLPAVIERYTDACLLGHFNDPAGLYAFCFDCQAN